MEYIGTPLSRFNPGTGASAPIHQQPPPLSKPPQGPKHRHPFVSNVCVWLRIPERGSNPTHPLRCVWGWITSVAAFANSIGVSSPPPPGSVRKAMHIVPMGSKPGVNKDRVRFGLDSTGRFFVSILCLLIPQLTHSHAPPPLRPAPLTAAPSRALSICRPSNHCKALPQVTSHRFDP